MSSRAGRAGRTEPRPPAEAGPPALPPVVGHESVRPRLLESRANALLLLGPARVVRRRLAAWLGQRLNCLAPVGLEPCGTCSSCRTFLAGTHPDYWEIGPSARTREGKEARRSIIPVAVVSARRDPNHDFDRHVLDFIETGPRVRAKVVVFDGAQYLNPEAANALLKSVEEPPAGVRFVFIAEDAHEVIPTIVSRCSPVRVPPVAALEMERALVSLEGELDPALLDFAAGRPGVLFERDRVRRALQDARDFLAALPDGLLAALTAADALEKGWSRDWSPGTLAYLLRDRPSRERLAADETLARTVEALAQYASPQLAFATLALDLRAAFRLD